MKAIRYVNLLYFFIEHLIANAQCFRLLNLDKQLTHEVGHWLGLEHTHADGCKGVGDYMDDIGVEKSCEKEPTFYCSVGLDKCRRDFGLNSINNCMSCAQVGCYWLCRLLYS